MEALQAISTHQDFRDFFLELINEVHETGVTEASWKVILQISIPKKGDLSQLSNWRPICLVNSIVKLINFMILTRIRPSVEPLLRDNQYGFRQNRSTAGAQTIMNEIKSKAFPNKSVCVAFIDFAKAFPSVSFAAIKASLKAYHAGVRLSEMIMSFYSNLKGVVRTPFGITDSSPITTGILQGDLLAPYLFVMVMDRILNKSLDLENRGLLLSSSGTRKRSATKRRWRSGKNSRFEAHGAQTASLNPLIAIFPAASL